MSIIARNSLGTAVLRSVVSVTATIVLTSAPFIGARSAEPGENIKSAIVQAVDDKYKLAQVMNDMVFSFAELGFQEYETSNYLTGILEDNGFAVQREISGIPTAWMASWGEGEPVIALISDIDGIPKTSQKPGVAYRDPIIDGAPGHGEGHNSGQVLNIIAALTVKEFMEDEGLSGTIRLYPGVAEEQLGSKAFYVRDGYFADVDAAMFAHVSNSFSTYWGEGRSNGLVSVRYDFTGESAHGAGSPWHGRSALDAVELMSVGMNYRREHLRLSQRTHSVIVDGGDQPNVVPSKASTWYYFREKDYEHIKKLWDIGDNMAQGAALMTGTSWDSTVLGAGWPRVFNRAIAERGYENMKRVGMPEWSEDDQALARAIQKERGMAVSGLKTEIEELEGALPHEDNMGGGTDDIGDVSWTVPTFRLNYPANIPNLAGHHWSRTISMATPIAHKGIVAGAKVQALTLYDLMTDTGLLEDAWDYFRNEQTREVQYQPLLSPDDNPAVHLNRDIMDRWRPAMKEFYYQPDKYATYLEQLGVDYPTLSPPGQN